MDKKDLFRAQRGQCWLCDGPMPFEDATFDHLIPISMGGRRGDNLKLAHKMCNNIRGCLEAEKSREYVQARLAGTATRLPTDRSFRVCGDKRKKQGEPGYWLQEYKRLKGHAPVAIEVPCAVVRWE